MPYQVTGAKCGRQNTFDPEARHRVNHYRSDGQGNLERFVYVRVRCAGCGAEQEVLVDVK